METKPITYFASPERDNQEKVVSDFKIIDSESSIKEVLNALPNVVLILNLYRQVVFVNKAYFSNTKDVDYNTILGLRHGELLGCIHSHENPLGCGTSQSCKYCGAVQVVLKSQQRNDFIEGEVRFSTGENGGFRASDFKISAAPLHIEKNNYTLVTLHDISHEKRKDALEKIFFHDLLNKAGSLSCFFENLKLSSLHTSHLSMMEVAANLSSEIVEEINAHRSLMEAESDELSVLKIHTSSKELIENVVKQIRFHTVSYDKLVEILPESENINFVTDHLILSRILMNMLKNALEATTRSGIVKIYCKKEVNEILISVVNEHEMSEEVKQQVFHRSFSTKGRNRGLGTYSMKLLGEKYLKGKVSFISEKGKGTIFSIAIPIK